MEKAKKINRNPKIFLKGKHVVCLTKITQKLMHILNAVWEILAKTVNTIVLIFFVDTIVLVAAPDWSNRPLNFEIAARFCQTEHRE